MLMMDFDLEEGIAACRYTTLRAESQLEVEFGNLVASVAENLSSPKYSTHLSAPSSPPTSANEFMLRFMKKWYMKIQYEDVVRYL